MAKVTGARSPPLTHASTRPRKPSSSSSPSSAPAPCASQGACVARRHSCSWAARFTASRADSASSEESSRRIAGRRMSTAWIWIVYPRISVGEEVRGEHTVAAGER